MSNMAFRIHKAGILLFLTIFSGCFFLSNIVVADILSDPGASGSSEASSSTPMTLPALEVITSDAASTTDTTAILNGAISSTGGSDAIESGFSYGIDPALNPAISTSTLGAQMGTTTFSQSITDLASSTTYYVRAYATNASSTAYGSIISFITASSSTTASTTASTTVTTLGATSVKSTVATANATMTLNGDDAILSRGFQYGLTVSYGSNAAEVGTFETGAFSASFTELTCNTVYHFRAYASSSIAAFYGSDLTFNTASCSLSNYAGGIANGGGRGTTDTVAPVITEIGAKAITPTSSSISWTTDELTDAQIEFGLTYSYGNMTKLDRLIKLSHTQIITDLSPNTLYHYRIKSKDSRDNYSSTFDQTFSTAADVAIASPVIPVPIPVPLPTPAVTPAPEPVPPKAVAPTEPVETPVLIPEEPTAPVETVYPPASIPPAGRYVANLGIGSSGAEVKALQTFLSIYPDASIYPEKEVTGIFDQTTQDAVGRYQIARGIKNPEDAGLGFVGQTTRDDINKVLGK